jgi:hypothetical protein
MNNKVKILCVPSNLIDGLINEEITQITEENLSKFYAICQSYGSFRKHYELEQDYTYSQIVLSKIIYNETGVKIYKSDSNTFLEYGHIEESNIFSVRDIIFNKIGKHNPMLFFRNKNHLYFIIAIKNESEKLSIPSEKLDAISDLLLKNTNILEKLEIVRKKEKIIEETKENKNNKVSIEENTKIESIGVKTPVRKTVRKRRSKNG